MDRSRPAIHPKEIHRIKDFRRNFRTRSSVERERHDAVFLSGWMYEVYVCMYV